MSDHGFVHILVSRVVTVVENWQYQAKKVMGNFLKAECLHWQ